MNLYKLPKYWLIGSQDYIKQLIVVFDQAEDLESVEDLHALCSLMQTICEFGALRVYLIPNT